MPRSAHPQRSTSNQSRPGRAVKGTSGFHCPPRLGGEAINEFCLPPASAKPTARQAVFNLVGGDAGLERERDS
jgi:hypothetical protein